MKMTKKEYADLVKQASPNSKLPRNMLRAFLTGGAICTLGQCLTELYKSRGLEKLDAGTACSITLVLLSALLTALKIYEKIAKFGGAGTLVPITGFSNAVVSPAIEFKSEGFITGMAAKMFTIAGPVIVFGVTAAMICGLIYWLTEAF